MRRLLIACLVACGCAGHYPSNPIERWMDDRGRAFESLDPSVMDATVAQTYFQDCQGRNVRLAELALLLDGATKCVVESRWASGGNYVPHQTYASFIGVWRLVITTPEGTSTVTLEEDIWIFQENGKFREWGDQTCP